MVVAEEPRYSADYLDPHKRSIANAVQVFFRDGTSTDRVAVEYPIGHRHRRREGLPLLREQFRQSVLKRFPAHRAEQILDRCLDYDRPVATPVPDFMELLAG